MSDDKKQWSVWHYKPRIIAIALIGNPIAGQIVKSWGVRWYHACYSNDIAGIHENDEGGLENYLILYYILYIMYYVAQKWIEPR